MAKIDVFNGDADGLCALVQLASCDRNRAHAILVRKPDGGFLVSARARLVLL